MGTGVGRPTSSIQIILNHDKMSQNLKEIPVLEKEMVWKWNFVEKNDNMIVQNMGDRHKI